MIDEKRIEEYPPMEVVRKLRVWEGFVNTPGLAPLILQAADLIESLQAQLTQSQAREKAAVGDLKIDSHCTLCKHHCSESGGCYGVSHCAVKGIKESWEWRGV